MRGFDRACLYKSMAVRRQNLRRIKSFLHNLPRMLVQRKMLPGSGPNHQDMARVSGIVEPGCSEENEERETEIERGKRHGER